MDVLYQLSYPGETQNCSERVRAGIAFAAMQPTVRWVLALTSVVMIAAGLAVYAFTDSIVGLVIAAIGAFDLVTMPLFLRKIGRAKAGSAPAAPEPEADPSYNPYARED